MSSPVCSLIRYVLVSPWIYTSHLIGTSWGLSSSPQACSTPSFTLPACSSKPFPPWSYPSLFYISRAFSSWESPDVISSWDWGLCSLTSDSRDRHRRGWYHTHTHVLRRRIQRLSYFSIVRVISWPLLVSCACCFSSSFSCLLGVFVWSVWCHHVRCCSSGSCGRCQQVFHYMSHISPRSGLGVARILRASWWWLVQPPLSSLG
jgi:hypothetical protein